MRILTDLHIYPVKSLGGIALQASVVQPRGLQYDRRWMLVDERGRFVSQREVADLALLGTALEVPHLVVFSRKNPAQRVHIPLEPVVSEMPETTVEVWDDHCPARVHAPEINVWFSEVLGCPLRLVFMPDSTVRPTDPAYAPAGLPVSFSDGYPFLVIGQASLDDLNNRLAQPLPMNRFRPNFVFSGGTPYEEDNWQEFSIGDTWFRGVKPCARCIITTTDQDTETRGPEPLKTLATYRKQEHRILFGQNVIGATDAETVVRVGMPIRVPGKE
ncbi:MAG: MOSC domain-containing protein [Lewinellaceae bacterium]|nr:MOSC domain-containing protein [Lewinellaceae bacterium]